MTDRKALIDKIEYFYIEIIEELKEAEQQLINDSQFRSLFRKKNYDGNIAHLRHCRSKALDLDTTDVAIDEQDEEAKDLMRQLRQALSAFRELCDAYVQLQVFLKKKAEGEKASFSTYKGIFDKVKQHKDDTNSALHDLDILYTDYTELYGE